MMLDVPKNKKLKVVLDTNILISAYLFPGKIFEKIIQLAINEYIKVYITEDILKEFSKVLERKFRYKKENIDKFIKHILSYSCLIRSHHKKVNIIKEDPDDNKFLECAMEAKADYLVTGDKKHLLPLKKFKKTKIVSPKEFIKALKEYEKRERRFGK